jgi:hypothetical protein
MTFYEMYSSEIWSFIGGLFSGGICASLLTFQFVKQNHLYGSGSIVDQSGAKAQGDIVGGDKKTR